MNQKRLFELLNENERTRSKVAENLSTAPDVLIALFENENNEDSFVLLSLAMNPNTPKHVLNELSKIRDSYIEEALVYNPSTPLTTVFRLGKEGRANAIKAMALHDNNLLNRISYFVEKYAFEKKEYEGILVGSVHMKDEKGESCLCIIRAPYQRGKKIIIPS